MLRRSVSLLLLGICTLSGVSHTQVAPSPRSTTQQLDEEATKVLSTLQTAASNLSPETKLLVFGQMNEALVQNKSVLTTPPTLTDAQGLVTANPDTLSLGEKMKAIDVLIDANQPQLQQVVIGGPQTPVNASDPAMLKSIADALNQLSIANTTVLSTGSISGLAQKAMSIGRIMWTYQTLLAKGDPMWQLAGTGFVTAPNVVTTACHVASIFADVSSGHATLKSDVVVRIDFSNDSSQQKLSTVSKILAVSGTTGCDAAQLAIVGGEGSTPLKVAAATSATKRVLVVGFPLLDNYRATPSCPTSGSRTDIQFCSFAKSHPTATKVASPGAVLSGCCDSDHGGVSVLTYNAPTDGGQSGSPVFDADTMEVVGIHYCCTGAAGTATTLLNCETWHPQNPAWNEAITVQSLLADGSLKSNFSDVVASTGQVAAAIGMNSK